MGNPDIVIIINEWFAKIVKGTDYDVRIDAISLAIRAFKEYFTKLEEDLDRDESFSSDVDRLLVYEIK